MKIQNLHSNALFKNVFRNINMFKNTTMLKLKKIFNE